MGKKCKKKNKYVFGEQIPLVLMVLPAVVLLFVFSYLPMSGFVLAFKDYKTSQGIFFSPGVGFYNFERIFGKQFNQLLWNSLWLSTLKLIFVFPSSIIFALLLNELRQSVFKKTVQTVSYLPYFISWVIVGSMAFNFLSNEGILNEVLTAFGLEPVNWYNEPRMWPAILTITGIWKGMGWGSIIFLAALTGVNSELYEAARIDGASGMKQVLHISLPGMGKVIEITLILSIGSFFKDDFEQIYALTNDSPALFETTNVFSTWIYRNTVQGGERTYGMATAMGLLQSTASFVLVLCSNLVIKRRGGDGLF